MQRGRIGLLTPDRGARGRRDAVRAPGGLTVNFHPDRLLPDGRRRHRRAAALRRPEPPAVVERRVPAVRLVPAEVLVHLKDLWLMLVALGAAPP